MATIKLLVIGGGGGGGGRSNSGGGGAGDHRYDAAFAITSQTYAVTVGASGAGGGNNTNGSSGGDSIFGSITSVGGGGGGKPLANGIAGGSGGGAGYGTGTGGAATGSGDCHAGGTSNSNGSPNFEGSGGGGAGAAGGNGSTGSGTGTGGNGIANSITGSSVTRAGGGGGGTDGSAVQAGGSGGGGAGGKTGGGSVGPVAGTTNTGSGGGGGCTGFDGAAGGSGIVIVSYVTADYADYTITSTGTITTDGANTVHSFTASGSFAMVAPRPQMHAWPNPVLRTPSIASGQYGFVQSSDLALLTAVPAMPFRQLDWPNPVRRINAPAWMHSIAQGINIPLMADYDYGIVWVTVAGVQRAQGRVVAGSIDFSSLVITDLLDETPNTCTFTARNFIPTAGQEVIVTLGSRALQNPERIFAGTILTVSQQYVGTADNQVYDVSCIDWTWQLNKRQVIKQYSSQTAGAIAADLIATYAPGFTSLNVAGGLDTIDRITFTNQTLTSALSQLAKRIGASWYVDYTKDLHFFVTESVTAPTALTAAHPSLSDVLTGSDLSQWITRAYSEGGGSNVAAAVAVGETILPLDDVSWYLDAGGVVVCGPQWATYTGRSTGGGGSLVGPGAGPASIPSAVIGSGAGIETGSHDYAVTFVTAAGETTAGPRLTVALTGVSAAPTTVASSGLIAGGSMDDGIHRWVVTFVTSTGETTAGPASSSVVAGPITATVADPVSAPSVAGPVTGGSMDVGTHKYGITFTTFFGETVLSPVSAAITITGAPNRIVQVYGIPTSPDPTVTGRNVYRQFNGTGAFKLVQAIADNTTTTLDDGLANASLGAAVHGENTTTVTTHYNQAPLSNLPIGNASVTGRKIYRQFNLTGTYKLVTTINNNTATTYTDSIANASLGADAPSSNTATANRVALSSIPIGGSTVTQRKVYRTVAAGSQLKLLATLADNTTTTYADSTADASLGANVPASDTSGLTQPSGQVIAGSTTLLVAGSAWASAAGGWAIIGNGQQVIRYTGITGSSLTGIPASGPGSIVASIGYNSTVTACPALTGIPASGAGSVLYAIAKGDPANLLAQVDDVLGQAALSVLLDPYNLLNGAAGIQEDYQQDGRISYTEALARATARLSLVGAIAVRISYKVRDKQTHSGRTVSVNLPAPMSVSGDFLIQRVTISDFSANPALFPTYSADASNTLNTFEALLASLRGRTS